MDNYGIAEELVGKTLVSVDLAKFKQSIRFCFASGETKIFGARGDCCSQSWIEHIEGVADVIGHPITEVTQPELAAFDKHDCKTAACDHDTLSVYHTRIHTANGSMTIEYRNDSNGYYGGWLELSAAGPHPDWPFYA